MTKLFQLALAPLTLGALFGQTPEITFDASTAFLKLPPGIYLGEAAGVATDSKGDVFVYTRAGEDATMGGSRFFTHGGS